MNIHIYEGGTFSDPEDVEAHTESRVDREDGEFEGHQRLFPIEDQVVLKAHALRLPHAHNERECDRWAEEHRASDVREHADVVEVDEGIWADRRETQVRRRERRRDERNEHREQHHVDADRAAAPEARLQVPRGAQRDHQETLNGNDSESAQTQCRQEVVDVTTQEAQFASIIFTSRALSFNTMI